MQRVVTVVFSQPPKPIESALYKLLSVLLSSRSSCYSTCVRSRFFFSETTSTWSPTVQGLGNTCTIRTPPTNRSASNRRRISRRTSARRSVAVPSPYPSSLPPTPRLRNQAFDDLEFLANHTSSIFHKNDSAPTD